MGGGMGGGMGGANSGGGANNFASDSMVRLLPRVSILPENYK